ncbi:MAG TPA: type III pantothenate kinase [Rickettsiales bacterium]|nr:type III pantothenate kinase [Rickettsiales bacterium]
MILTVDVGNSNIVLAVFSGEKVFKKWRIVTDKTTSKEEYETVLVQLMRFNDCNKNIIDGIVYGSVVPEVDDNLLNALKFLNKKIINVGDKNTKLNLKVRKEIKDELIGQDIVVNIIAGKKKFKENFIIIDMGTATTFDVALTDGEYAGSVIAPGAKLGSNALHTFCSQLPEVEIKKPEKVLGTNTEVLMQSGLYYGYIGLIKEIVEQIKREYKNINFKIYITGGLSVVFIHDLKFVDGFCPNLTSEGLNEVWYINK